MRKINAAVTGIHGYVPDYILTNKELETIVETNDEWIEYRNIEVQGIQRRSAKTTKTGRRRKMVKTNNL